MVGPAIAGVGGLVALAIGALLATDYRGLCTRFWAWDIRTQQRMPWGRRKSYQTLTQYRRAGVAMGCMGVIFMSASGYDWLPLPFSYVPGLLFYAGIAGFVVNMLTTDWRKVPASCEPGRQPIDDERK